MQRLLMLIFMLRILTVFEDTRSRSVLHTDVVVQTPRVGGTSYNFNDGWKNSALKLDFNLLLHFNCSCLYGVNLSFYTYDRHLQVKLPSSNTANAVKRHVFVYLLLLLSGNIHPNPGPGSLNTPDDFKSRSGIGFIHLNIRSLLPKMDSVRIWADSTDADFIVLSETWPSKAIPNSDINISRFSLFRCDRLKKGGGIVIYVRNKFHTRVITAISISKMFELLVVKIELSKDAYLTLAGCYRPLSANSDSLVLLEQHLSAIDFNEILLVGDFNCDWLTPASDCFKSFCNTLNLTQLIDSPTRLNLKCFEKSTLLDLFLTNAPHKYTDRGVFANGVSDHCVIAAVRNTKRPKFKPQTLVVRNRKHFVEQNTKNKSEGPKQSLVFTRTSKASAGQKCSLGQSQKHKS